ncbi:MAG: ABC transporter ATP-binding protein/permease [Defluviitaleaceae bacterium]|nr:ABC transporter ATP-binding protein/permease [Defluviitaleaceae bacterium]
MSFDKKMKLIIRGYKTISGLVPGYLTCIAIRGIALAIFPFINIYMSARIVTGLMQGYQFQQILNFVIIMIVLDVAIGLILAIMQRINNIHSAKFSQLSLEPLNEKIRETDYGYIEHQNTHLMVQRIKMRQNMSGLGLPRLIWEFENIISNFFKVVFSITLITTAFISTNTIYAGAWEFLFEPWFSLVIIGVIIVNVVLEMLRVSANQKKTNSATEKFMQSNRVGNYYLNNLVFDYQAGKDLKLYSLKKLVFTEINDVLNDLYDNLMARVFMINAKYESLGKIASIIFTGIVYAYIAIKALFGSFPIGNIIQYIGALGQFGGGINKFMSSISVLMENTDSLGRYFEFIDLPDKKSKVSTQAIPAEVNVIEFENVSFKYPGSEDYALKNFSLKINKGTHLAIVGMNGSGKTTMVKLLCRLYDPTEGEIKLNNINIKDFGYENYLEMFSVVFQDFKLFSFPLDQNIASSDHADSGLVKESLAKAGFDIDSHKMDLSTAIYKDFEESGIEVSGGEAQKIAIARALYKNSPIVVLDEPTAALDPIAESEIYSKFNKVMNNKTAIYISHRLSSCRFCDIIAVFHKGELIEYDTHENLLNNTNSKYYEMWNAQAQHYN